jgi:hypothetical protein
MASSPLVLESFFDGPVGGEGSFVNRWTRSRRTFSVAINPTWDGRVLTLVEDFVYSDGTTERATWRMEKTSSITYIGSRDNLVGVARIWNDDGVVRLSYVLTLAGIDLDFAEIMSLDTDGTLRGRASVRKWGISIGRLELAMRRI